MTTLSEWKKSGETRVLNGFNIFTRVDKRKNKPVILLIHGFPSASWDWEAMWPALTEHYYAVTLDMLGFGFSDKPKNQNYLIAEQADLYEALLDSLSINNYHILCHDYGNTVAQELLSRQVFDKKKKRIQSVCFLNGGLFPESHRPVFIQKLLLSPIGFVIAKLTSKQKLTKNLNHIFGDITPPSQQIIDGFWELMTYNNGTAVMHKLIHYINQRHQYRQRWVGAMTITDIPMKFIAGLEDPISGAHMVAKYKELIPKADVVELKNIGHYPQVECTAVVTNTYLTFLDKIITDSI